MALPSPHDPCWLRLADAAIPGFTTRQFGLQLLLRRMRDPEAGTLDRGMEVYLFFKKYEPILGAELEQLTRR